MPTILVLMCLLFAPPVTPSDVVVALPSAPPPAALTTAGKLWALQIGSSTPGLALTDRGGVAMLFPGGVGPLLLSAFDDASPQPVWESTMLGFDGAARAADSRDVVLANRLDILGPTTSQGVLTLHTSSSSEPVWSHAFAPQLFSTPLFDVSRDGRTVVSAFFADASSQVEFRVHDAATGVVLAQHEPLLQTPTNRFDLSPDGGSMAAGSSSAAGAAYVLEVATGAVLLETTGGIPAEQALSAGGEVLVTRESEPGLGWHVRALSRASGAWVTAVQVDTPLTVVPQDLVVSDDGRVLAAAWFDQDQPLAVTLRAYEVATGALLLERVLASLTGLSNQVADLEISADGSRLALASWGTGSIGPSELSVFDPFADALVAAFPAGGTVFDATLSADGRRLLVVRIGNHAMQGHFQKTVELYDLGGADLAIHGVPSVGAAIDVQLLGPPDSPAVLLLSAGLLPTPLPVGVGGALALDPATLFVLPLGDTDAEGQVTRTLDVPALPALVGLVAYAQGATTGPSALGQSWIQLRLLP